MIGFRQALGERNAAAADADQREIFGAAAFFHDFMGQTLERAVDFFRGEELSFFYDAHLAEHPSIDRRKFAAAESLRVRMGPIHAFELYSGTNRTQGCPLRPERRGTERPLQNLGPRRAEILTSVLDWARMSSPAPARSPQRPASVDLRVSIGSLALKNPIIAASGTFAYGVEFAHIVDLNRLGGIVVKGLSAQPMEGAPAPGCARRPAGW